MCMEDIRLGRKIVTEERSIVISGAIQILALADPKRVTLRIHGVNTLVSCVSTNPAVTLTNGMPVLYAIPAIDLNIKEHGQIVTRAWFLIGQDTGSTTNVIEGRLEAE